MAIWKAICITLFVLEACSLFGSGHEVAQRSSSTKVLGQVASSASTAQIGDAQKVRYQVCADEGDVIYYCPGNTICCTPGDPASKCCPAEYPLCVLKGNSKGCCPTRYPQPCGKYCCEKESVCCNEETCCKTTGACCGAQCCQDEAPCCKQGGTSKCCDKVTMGCCDGYGCVAPCTSQFDAIGCQLSISLSLDDKVLGASFAKRRKLWRILRPDENPKGIVAKKPAAKKEVLSHVNCGSRKNYGSQYISTSASLDVAKYYKQKGEEKGLTGLRICEFEVDKLRKTCQIVDLTTEKNRKKYLGNAVCKNYARASAEVLLRCSVPIPCRVVGSPPRRCERKTFSDARQQL